jgi:hypothetical protein
MLFGARYFLHPRWAAMVRLEALRSAVLAE